MAARCAAAVKRLGSNLSRRGNKAINRLLFADRPATRAPPPPGLAGEFWRRGDDARGDEVKAQRVEADSLMDDMECSRLALGSSRHELEGPDRRGQGRLSE